MKAQSHDMSTLKISKERAEKYQQLLEDEKEYVVEKLLAVRGCENGELEFLQRGKDTPKIITLGRKLKPSTDP